MKARNILVLNGPNLDMLGVREPEVYGNDTLEALEDEAARYGERRGAKVTCLQSNSEGELIDIIHEAPQRYDGIVYNPGAHTHYSYALRDAIGSVDTPVVEVHLSDISDREAFRRISVIAPACIGQVKGMGISGYCRAIDILCEPHGHERLGEGFEERLPDKSIIVGDHLDRSAASSDASGAHAASSEAREAPVEFPSVFAAPPEQKKAAPSHAHSDEPVEDAAPGKDASVTPVVSAEPAEPVEPTKQPAHSAESAAPASAALDRTDYAAAFAGAVAAIDAGLLSFERQAAVRKAYGRLGIMGLLVRDTSNIHWITALDDVFDDERAHGLLVAGEGALLHTDSRYANAVRSTAQRIGSDIMVNEERISHARFAHNALTAGGAHPLAGKLGIEDTITYAEFVKMVEAFGTDGLAPTSEVVLGLRAVKDAGEITRLKAAQAVTDAAFAHIVGFMRPGMTEREVQLELEDFMVRHGAEGLSFRSIVATGANGADPHAVPGNTRLEAGQCVVMDFGAKAYGYCSDMTRTVFLGAPEGPMASAWETLRRANEAVEAFLKPGVTGAEAHALAEKVLEEGGFGGTMGHGLGHGVGLDVHELPSLNPRNKASLVEGNVVTVEPGIYLPGKFGMRLEDFGVITADGYEVFTKSTHDMVII